MYTACNTFSSHNRLTAFVMKIFSQAKQLVFIDNTVICDGVKWLTQQQRVNGAFKELYRVHHKSMTVSFYNV